MACLQYATVPVQAILCTPGAWPAETPPGGAETQVL
jgi:hypothetical protein